MSRCVKCEELEKESERIWRDLNIWKSKCESLQIQLNPSKCPPHKFYTVGTLAEKPSVTIDKFLIACRRCGETKILP
jgi:hypothetical protein